MEKVTKSFPSSFRDFFQLFSYQFRFIILKAHSLLYWNKMNESVLIFCNYFAMILL